MAVKKSYAVKVLACLVALVVLFMSPLDAMAASVSSSDVIFDEHNVIESMTGPDIMLLSEPQYTALIRLQQRVSGSWVTKSEQSVLVGYGVSTSAQYGQWIILVNDLDDQFGEGTLTVNFDFDVTSVYGKYNYNISTRDADGNILVKYDIEPGNNVIVFDGDLSAVSYVRIYIGTNDNNTASLDFTLNSIDYYDPTAEEEPTDTKNILELLRDFFGSFFEKITSAISGAVESTFDSLGEKIKGWFIPTAEELTAFLDEVNAWFSERLGFIWYPFSLALDLVSALAGGSSDQQFVIPALHLNILGESYAIWNEITVDMDAFGIFKYVRLFTSFLLVSAVIKLAIDKWDEWIGGHGTG